MGLRKKKGQAGEAVKYVTRGKACRYLQINIRDFRRLCIMKGIYPREPKSRRKAQHGDMSIKTLFLRRDMIYLSHEPIIWKLREEKIYRRKLKHLISKNEKKAAALHEKEKKPEYKLDHMVLERYPDFIKAVRDLDDALSTCFLYAALPQIHKVEGKLIRECRRLTTEFMNFVIEARALRMSFISFRGYYYRAQINGEMVTWLVPHPFPPEYAVGVDFNVMKYFVELFVTMMGFVNFKLYQSLNLHYPPKLPTSNISKRKRSNKIEEELNVIQALSVPVVRDFVEKENEEDYDPTLLNANDKNVQLARVEKAKTSGQMKLFEGVKFFLGRETNRESLTFVIRSSGGLVSWDALLGPGATYDQNDKDIVYEIVDRPSCDKKHLSRYYIQPQWVYDSFNAACLLPVQSYFVGQELPAHLSPFDSHSFIKYIPPEMQRIRALRNEINLVGDQDATHEHGGSDNEEELEDQDIPQESANRPDRMVTQGLITKKDKNFDLNNPLAKMAVVPSRPKTRNIASLKAYEMKQDKRMLDSMVKPRLKRLYNKIQKKEAKEEKDIKMLQKKRILYEQVKKKEQALKAKETAEA